jgi:isocitrate/isopropylmalate dehydrogenase
VPDDVSLRELLLRIRFGFDLYVNLRPVEVLPGIETPLKGKAADDVHMLFVRENTEGEYCGIGGRFKRGTEDEFAIQQSVFSRKGVGRILRYAFEQARQRPRKRYECHQVQRHAALMVLWMKSCEVSHEYPDVKGVEFHVDALRAHDHVPESLTWWWGPIFRRYPDRLGERYKVDWSCAERPTRHKTPR